jgi:hypothetical protein
MQDLETYAQQIHARIHECLSRAVRIYCDQARLPVVHAVVEAYLFALCRDRVGFLRSALRYLRARRIPLPDAGAFSLPELMVHPPARWEFEHVDVFGTVSAALCCARRYRICSRFVCVYPVQNDDPLIFDREPNRIPMRHKTTSPWFHAFVRRQRLKNELGAKHRSLVGYARKLTKTEFLEQFAANPGAEIPMIDRKGRNYTLRRLIPDISPHALLTRTGYTPAQFWREVRHPNTQESRKPQMELAL